MKKYLLIKRPRLAKWTRDGIADITETMDELLNKIPWMNLLGCAVLTIVVAAGYWLPWLTEGK